MLIYRVLVKPRNIMRYFPPRRLLPVIALSVPVAQVIGLLWAIWTHTLSVPWWDEWATVGFVERAEQGTLTIHDIWAPFYFSHRIVLPRLLNFALIESTGWNRQIEMTFNLAVAIAGFALILRCARITVESSTVFFALLIPLSLLLLSWSQYGNWFLPFQLQNIATLFGVAVCLWALAGVRVGRNRLGMAAVGALIATLSSAAGLVAWIAFIPCVARSGRRSLAAWCTLTLAVWLVYLYNFPQNTPMPTVAQAYAFVLIFLGAPIGYPSPLLSLLIGAASLPFFGGVLYVYWRRHGMHWSVTPWICLALYALGAAVMAARGRAWTDASFEPQSRYLFLPALWWVALIVLASLFLRDLAVSVAKQPLLSHRRLSMKMAVAAVIVGLFLVTTAGLLRVNIVGMEEGVAWQDNLLAHQWCIVEYETAPDSCLSLFFPISDKQINVGYAAYLQQRRFGIFARQSDNQPSHTGSPSASRP